MNLLQPLVFLHGVLVCTVFIHFKLLDRNVLIHLQIREYFFLSTMMNLCSINEKNDTNFDILSFLLFLCMKLYTRTE